ncbi:unnamed protein product [Rhizoctonia solani]|uniref:glutathione-specific gamma-glutamylcyclotransferase n=1 Tax=Rhizoctonia solani TaxID=456999 RepID=A0A8H3AC96_9AGAM|nr:unnamed protein product [Rhizoctonia solani]CAE6426235.1 unnamed protein product [Rhizoctonia solani]
MSAAVITRRLVRIGSPSALREPWGADSTYADQARSVVGSEPVPALARKIWESSGPSGPNKEYLYQLARAVRELSPESYDSHLSALELEVRRLDKHPEE